MHLSLRRKRGSRIDAKRGRGTRSSGERVGSTSTVPAVQRPSGAVARPAPCWEGVDGKRTEGARSSGTRVVGELLGGTDIAAFQKAGKATRPLLVTRLIGKLSRRADFDFLKWKYRTREMQEGKKGPPRSPPGRGL